LVLWVWDELEEGDYWNFIEVFFTLSRVKLLVNKITRDHVAMKIINLDEHPSAEMLVKKEIGIHRLLDNVNIIKFYGSRLNDKVQYLFLEYASSGELYDRIGEPNCPV